MKFVWVFKKWLSSSILFSILTLTVLNSIAIAQTNHKSNNNLKGSGAASGGSGSGTVTPDLFTGTMSYAIPIEVAQGRRGLEPALSLTYRSDNKNGWLGTGWELEVGAIERSTKDLNYSDGANNYVVRMAGATGDLVQIPNGEYRAKIEGGFSRIEKVGEHWKMTDKVGTVYRFGFTPDSRQEFTPSPGIVQVFRWSLDQVVDTNGNVMSFTYSKDQGQIYLDRIDYSPNSYVKFYLEAGRPDIPDMYTTKFSVKTAKRLKTIDVFGNGNRVRTYKLNYTQSWPTSQSLLTSVLQFGKDAQVNSVGEIVNEPTATKLRPITLGYESSPVPPVSKVLKDPISSTETGSFGGWNHGTGDFNGDGRTDIQLFVANGSGWRSYVALSKGDGTFDPAVSWTDLLNYSGGWIPGTADFNGDGKTDIYVSFAGEAGQGGWKTRVALSNEYGTFGTPIPWGDIHNYTGGWIQGLGDFNGDGKTDISLSVGDVNGWRTHVALSNGDGTFAAPIPWTQPGSFGGWNHGVGDFNGDGKTDLYLYFADGGSWRTHVALSNGDGTFAAEVPWTESDDYSGDWSHGTGDFNGDGKTDISLYVSDSSGGWRVEIAFSKGNGTFSTPVPWSKPGNLGGWHQGIGDFNADGKTDIFLYFNDVDGWRAHVALSKGDGTFAPPTYWEKVLNYESWGQGSGDFTGDGKTDLHLFAGDSSGWRTYVSASNFGREGLLTSISNGIGGMTTIGYTPSTNYQNTQLPFPVLTLSSITTSTPTLDGTTLTSTTTYSYDGGYYHIPKRDFRGFHHVTATGPAGPDGERTITHTWFHQGDDTAVEANIPGVDVGYMKGKPYRVKVTDGSGAEYSQTDISYVADGTAPHFNPPSRVDNWTCEGHSCNSGKKTETYYEGYDDYGNPTVEYQKGDGSDDRTIQRTFTNNDNGKWIVGLPLSEIIYKGHSTNLNDRISQTDSFYDGAANCSAQSENTNPDKGNLTRVRRWLDGNVYVDAGTAFNAYGNPFCTRDANGNISTISYDPSGTFPTIVTNPLGHQTKSAYYGVDGVPADMGLYGQVKSVTDPSNKTSTYQYDSLGRKARVDSPDGSWGTTSYNNLGEGVGVQHILTNSAAGLSSWSYFDGLGRPVLEKRTGPPGKFIFTKQEYNSNGTIKRSSLPYFQGDPLKWKEFTYDSMGRVTKTVNPDQSTSSATFGLWTVTGVDASGHQKRETRDAFGRLRKVEEFTGIAPAANFYAETYYEYDLLGNLIQVKDAHENKTTMRYDNLGRKIAMSDPDMGSCGDLKTIAPNPTFPWYPAPCWNYLYDANGNLLKQIDAEGSILEFTYDPLNRVKTKAFSDRTPPSAPAGVTATVVSASQIDLSWSASTDNSGVKEYRVDRCNNRPGTPACSNFIQIASLVTTSYSDTGRTDGMDYRYRIRAMDTSGNFGSYSSVATATTPDITPPSTPTGLTAGAFCSNRVDVSWTASTDNVGVTAYQLERCNGSATCTAYVEIETVSAPATPEISYNDTQLAPNTIYRYRVRARDTAGLWSGYSTPFSVMTPPPPTTPSGLSAVLGLGAVTNNANQVDLSWIASTAPPDNMLSFYEVERSSNNDGFDVIEAPVVTSITDTDVNEEVTYLYRVRAVDCSGGKSAYSNVDMATTIVFTDDLRAEATEVPVVRVQHFIELRKAVNAMRASVGLAPVVWTDATLVGIVINLVHIQELRDNLNLALTAIGFPTRTFTDPVLTPGETVKRKVHVEDLRQGVK